MPSRKSKTQRNRRLAARQTPNSSGSRYRNVGSDVVLPRNKIAGKSRGKRPGSDTDKGGTITNELSRIDPRGIDYARGRTTANEIIKILMREEGIFSSAAHSMISLASNSRFKIAGYDPSGTMDIDVMAMAWQLLDRLDTMHDYSQGYNDRPGVRTLVNTLMTDTVSTGACAAELVLNSDFTPDMLVPLGYDTIEWGSKGDGNRYPTQENGDIDLNLPTVFIGEYGRHPQDAYATSILRPGLNNTFGFNEFLEDTRRAVNRTGHSRMIATLIAEQIRESAPDDVKADEEKMAAYMDQQYDAVTSALQEVEPEDAIVSFDSVQFSVEDTGGSKSDYKPLLETFGNLMGASVKTPASVSGLRAAGGQGLSNAETLIYIQVVDSLRIPVEEVLSRALTLALRLLGIEGYVKFEFDTINLRPEDELEAYRATKQKRVLELLSWGLLNDAEACWELGLRPQGLAEFLSGTRFYVNEKNYVGESERVSSTGRALNPGTPSKSGGADQ